MPQLHLNLLILLVLPSSHGQLSYFYYPTPCDGQAASINPSACIQFLRQKAADPAAFWFGTSFSAICGNKNPRSAECLRSTPDKMGNYETLGSRLFSDDKFTSSTYLSQLSDIFYVSYVSTPGSYAGCNSTRFGGQMNVFEVNPHMAPLPAWNTRNPPQFRINSCNSQQLCTIVFYDAGVGVLHSVWVNWPKNGDIGNYASPNTNMRREGNPYVFLVFRQSSEILNFPNKTYTVWEFRLPDFQKQYQLQGPIAMTYMMIRADEYSLNNLEKGGLVQNCPTLLVESVQQEGYGAIGAIQDLQLKTDILDKIDVWMTVKFVGKTFGKGDIWVDSIQNGYIQRYAIAEEPTVALSPRMFQPTPDDLSASMFTLVMVEMPRGASGIPYVSPMSNFQFVGGTLCHWLVYNIPGDKISQGTKTVSYIGDMNPHNVCSLRQYYILLYRQTRPISSLSSFVPMTSCSLNNFQCRIDLPQLVASNGLELAGFSRFRVIC